MNISIRKQSDVQVLQLHGDLRLGDAVDSFAQATQELMLSGDRRFVLNLDEVPRIDSSGIGALVKLVTTAKASGGDVKLVKPSDFASKTLKLVGVLNLFEVHESEDNAIAAFQ